MNKNLKKVISTIAALAVSASSFVALAATSFPDVEETATYAKAVNELVGLGIVNGYEDGTFGPDKLVTRAEITKMIVAALGMTSTAEASANSATQFSDVPAGHWAAGYVTVGTNQGFINGMGDGTFDPDANVQFLQAEKMLVGACGYTTWAENAGGWPSGYSSYANSLNLAKNVAGSPTNSTELNRGQVAQLISNAIDTPVCVQDGYETTWSGSVPKLVQKNGHGDDYQTLLTKKHNAYKVNGRVTATYRTGGVDDGEVTFQVEKAENFDDVYYQGSDADDTISIDAIAGDSGAEDYLLEYAEAIIQENDNDEWEIVSISSTTKNDIVSFDTDMYDDENSGNKDGDTYKSGFDSKLLYFFTDDAKRKTSSYKLNGYNGGDEDDVVYYVNGVKFDGFDKDDFTEYVENNDGGTITLVDAPATGSSSTDGRYDYVMITFYADAIVDGVTESSSTPKINFSANDQRIKGSLTVDLDDDDTTYSFELDGADIAVTDLAEYDVLSIAYDVTGEFDDSKFYDVLVSRNVVSGKVTAVGGDDGYMISGTYYEPNTSEGLLEDLKDSTTGDYTSGDINSGTEYTLYLNAFGKFVDYEEGEGSVKNLVVLDGMYTQYGSDWYVSYYDQTGEKQSKKVKTSGDNLVKMVKAIYNGAEKATASDIDDYVDAKVKKNFYDRVAEISVNSSDEVTYKKAYSATSTSDTKDGDQYYAKSNKIGSLKLSDSTVFLDFTDYEDDGEVGVWSASSFVDESDYVAYAYSKSTSNSTWRFVLIADGASDISGTSSMAVYASASETTNKDDESTDQIKAYVNGEETYLVLSTDLEVENYNLAEGAPFFYTLDSEDYVDEIYPVLNSSATDALSSEADFRTTTFAAAKAETTYGSFDANLTSTFFDAAKGDADENGAVNFGTKSSEAYIHFGPVVDKNTSSVTLAAYNDTYEGTKTTNLDKCDDYSFAEGMVAYVYDYDYSSSKRMSVGTKSAINKTYIGANELLDGKNGSYVNWDTVESVSYALVKVYDGDATEALVITNND